MGDIFRNAKSVLMWLGEDYSRARTFSWMNSHVLQTLVERGPRPEYRNNQPLQNIMEQGPWPGHDFRLPRREVGSKFARSWIDLFEQEDLVDWKKLGRVDPTDSMFWSNLGLKPKLSSWQQCWHEYLDYIQRNNWFRRCWVGQEFFLANSVEVLCGKKRMAPNFTTLWHLTSWINKLELAQKRAYSLSPAMRLFDYPRPWDLFYISSMGTSGSLNSPAFESWQTNLWFSFSIGRGIRKLLSRLIDCSQSLEY